MLLIWSIVAVISCISECRAYEYVEPLVQVEQGKLRGTVEYLLDGVAYYSFKGIPYARPPVGELRFQPSDTTLPLLDKDLPQGSRTDHERLLPYSPRLAGGLASAAQDVDTLKDAAAHLAEAPQPPLSWTGVRDASKHGPVCPQYDFNTNQIINGNENCLFINVYTRSIQLFGFLPVMVYIHGGGFSSGSGNQDFYGPEFLMQHNVVVVTINYRLEVLGFLSLDTPEVPGNAGMKDQVLALQWVKENIDRFGADPNKITIFGESAGAVAVTYHIMSPMSRGLFNKAIAQSGVCIDDSGIATDGKDRAFRVAKFLGKDTTDIKELLQFLRTVPASKLANVTYVTETADEKLRGVPMRFGPVVEKKFDGIEAFISEEPVKALTSSELNNVTLILGYNSAEGLIMLADQLKKANLLNENSSYLVPRELLPKVTKDKAKELGQSIMKFYTGDKGMGNDSALGIVNMRTDMHFAYNIHRFAHLYSSLNIPVFLYRFEYATDLNIVKNFLGYRDMPGACHADDLFYIFYNDLNKKVYSSQNKLKRTVFQLTKLWANFATTGNPTEYPDYPEVKNVTWIRYSSSGRHYLALDEVMTPRTRADAARMDMWNKMYCDLGVPCIH